MKITVQFIRHGKTDGNLKRKFMGGKLDEPLCVEGISALKELCGKGTYFSAEEIFSSPMKRCIETSKVIFPQSKPEIIEEFRELNFGLFEGKTHEELLKIPEYEKWLDSKGRGFIPEGERYEDFILRTNKGFEKVLEKIKAEKIALVVHGGIIMSVLSKICNGEYYDYYTENGHGYIAELVVENSSVREVLEVKKF